MPKYSVFAHQRVLRALKGLKEKDAERIKDVIGRLGDYPLSLREMDAQKLVGIERVFRIRVGEYRVIFSVDKVERTIFVTHLGKRESIYEG